MPKPDYPAVTIPIAMRFKDIDAYGHVNNSVFFTYLEEARIKLIGEQFRVEMKEEQVFVVGHAACKYKRPIQFGTDLYVTMTVRDIRRASFVVDYLIHDAEESVYATAETTLISYDPVKQKATAVPAWLDGALLRAAEKWGSAPPPGSGSLK